MIAAVRRTILGLGVTNPNALGADHSTPVSPVSVTGDKH